MPDFSFSALRGPELRVRVMSSVILAPLVLLAAWLGGPVFALTVLAATAVGLKEWLRLIDDQINRAGEIALYVSHVIILVAVALGWPSQAFLLLLILMPANWWLAYNLGRDAKRALLVMCGLPYMAGAGLALIYLRNLPDGLFCIFYLLAVVWGTDCGAYIFGKLIGGPKLAPRISPGKTWAGAIGGVILGVSLAAGTVLAMGVRPLALYGLLAVFLSAAAQAGDLFKSFFKRRAGVKDSGKLIPGHGGMLDRIDGLAFAAIFLALFEALG